MGSLRICVSFCERRSFLSCRISFDVFATSTLRLLLCCRILSSCCFLACGPVLTTCCRFKVLCCSNSPSTWLWCGLHFVESRRRVACFCFCLWTTFYICFRSFRFCLCLKFFFCLRLYFSCSFLSSFTISISALRQVWRNCFNVW